MQSIYQKTIIKNVSIEGIGLHSGKISKLNLIQSGSNTGIIFKRIDLKKENIIEANFKNVSSTKLCTKLTNTSGSSVSTVEHLMAALYITGIDNLVIEIDNEEVPIMDGSSKDFIELITRAGTKDLESKRKYLKIMNKVSLKDGEKNISIEPSNNGFSVDFRIKYSNQIIGNQSNCISFYDRNLEEVYSSRTFCLHEDIEKIKKIGLAKGGSLNNAIVVQQDKILNDGGLRNKKEFVNHKILDLAGDFLLSGYRILGDVRCEQGGHQLSNLFLRKLFVNSTNFLEIDLENLKIVKKSYKNQDHKIAVNA